MGSIPKHSWAWHSSAPACLNNFSQQKNYFIVHTRNTSIEVEWTFWNNLCILWIPILSIISCFIRQIDKTILVRKLIKYWIQDVTKLYQVQYKFRGIGGKVDPMFSDILSSFFVQYLKLFTWNYELTLTKVMKSSRKNNIFCGWGSINLKGIDFII